VTFYTINSLDWPPYLDKEQGAEEQSPEDGRKRYAFTRTNSHSGHQFQMTISERYGDNLMLAF